MKPLRLRNMQCRSLSILVIALLFFVLSVRSDCANAAQMTIKNASVILSGKLVHGDFDRFESLIDSRPMIVQVVFENCFGGYVDEGIKIGELIRLRRFSTIAKGQVQSSCAYAFLAGVSRRFDSGFGAHLILLHATHNESAEKDVASRANLALIPYLQILSGGKLTPEILSLMKQSTTPSQGVVFVRQNWIIASTEKVAYCNGSEHGNLSDCLMLPHVDALQMGVVTERN